MINEFKIICDEMKVDPFDVIKAASTKPFGFVPYYPGPGWGGHCIPVDPFYLSWKAKEFGLASRFIELAGELNHNTQKWVIEKVVNTLNDMKKSLSNSKILILGLAYKPNVDDARESPSLSIFSRLIKLGANVNYSDPFFDKFPNTRKYSYNKSSVQLKPDILSDHDLVVILTNHSEYDYEMIYKHSKKIIDTRGVFPSDNKVVRA